MSYKIRELFRQSIRSRIHSVLDQKVSGVVGNLSYEIRYPNAPVNENRDVVLKVYILEGTSRKVEVGNESPTQNRIPGQLRFQVMVPVGTGDYMMSRICDMICRTFDSVDVGEATFYSTTVEEVGVEGSKYRHDVICPFDLDFGYVNPVPLPSLYLPFDNIYENSEYSWYGETYSGAGKHDGAFVFDNAAVLSVPAPTLDPNAYSVVFWINARGVIYIGELDVKVIWRGDINNLSDPVPHFIFNTNKDFYSGDVCYHDDSFPLPSEVTGDLFDETWRHVAITYDGAKKRFYLDGVLRHTAVASPAPVANDTLNFGGVPGYYFKIGSLDDIGFFSGSVLDHEQINEIYSSSDPLGTPL